MCHTTQFWNSIFTLCLELGSYGPVPMFHSDSRSLGQKGRRNRSHSIGCNFVTGAVFVLLLFIWLMGFSWGHHHHHHRRHRHHHHHHQQHHQQQQQHHHHHHHHHHQHQNGNNEYTSSNNENKNGSSSNYDHAHFQKAHVRSQSFLVFFFLWVPEQKHPMSLPLGARRSRYKKWKNYASSWDEYMCRWPWVFPKRDAKRCPLWVKAELWMASEN